jgi:MarR family transcriptional regulator, lower aerobic nicotinate degradation pathway regulator
MLHVMKEYPLPPRLHDSTMFLMVRVIKGAHRQANRLFKGEKLRLMHYVVAAYIANYDDLSQKTLSELLIMDPSDTGTIIRELEEAGYVTRHPNAKDRRRFNLAITPIGTKWLRKRDKSAQAFEEMFLHPLSPEERTMYYKLLIALLER